MKILLIEDDVVINNNIKQYLTQEGFEVEVAYDGLIGERLLKKTKVDCVILDINLPYKNGFTLCEEFRKKDTVTPVLMLTAFSELEDKVTGFDCGADDYLTKPFYMKEVLLRINSLVKRTQANSFQESDPFIRIDELVINQKTKQVWRCNIELVLTPREYQILLKLCLAKGELVDKKELIEEIWGGSFDANTNTIEVYINFLRKKVDKPFAKALIKTKIGYGYFLDLSTRV